VTRKPSEAQGDSIEKTKLCTGKKKREANRGHFSHEPKERKKNHLKEKKTGKTTSGARRMPALVTTRIVLGGMGARHFPEERASKT